MHTYAKNTHTHIPTCRAAGTLRAVYGGSLSLPHHKCVFCYTREHGEKRGIHVGVYLSFGQIQPGAAVLAGTLHQTPAAPVPPASQPDTHTHTYCTRTGTGAHTQHKFYPNTHTHTYLSILAISRCVCLSLPTILGPPRAGISLSFPQTHTHIHTHTVQL